MICRMTRLASLCDLTADLDSRYFQPCALPIVSKNELKLRVLDFVLGLIHGPEMAGLQRRGVVAQGTGRIVRPLG